MPNDVRYFRARHVATMTDLGVIEDGCVVVSDGRIQAVGRTRDVSPPRIDSDIAGLLMPGLINAHTHLELTNVPRPPVAGTFPEWLWELFVSLRSPDAAAFADRRARAVEEGIAQCLSFGVTCVGDITQSVDAVRPVLARGPIRSVSYGECFGLGERRGRFEALLSQAVDPRDASALLMIGVSPHAPYTVDAAGYAEAWTAGRGTRGVTTHLAETADECEFLRDFGGGFGGLYARLGRTDLGPGRGFEGSPIAWLDRITTPDVGPGAGDVLAHVNYCSDADLAILARWGAAVAWCPRTHAYFGHPPHRWRAMRAMGIKVCVGTDSCASSPDLNLVDDLRLVRQQCPDEPAAAVWAMATSVAADALPWGGAAAPSIGRLRPGTAADLTAWSTRTADPLAEVLDASAALPTNVWIGGRLERSNATNDSP